MTEITGTTIYAFISTGALATLSAAAFAQSPAKPIVALVGYEIKGEQVHFTIRVPAHVGNPPASWLIEYGGTSFAFPATSVSTVHPITARYVEKQATPIHAHLLESEQLNHSLNYVIPKREPMVDPQYAAFGFGALSVVLALGLRDFYDRKIKGWFEWRKLRSMISEHIGRVEQRISSGESNHTALPNLPAFVIAALSSASSKIHKHALLISAQAAYEQLQQSANQSQSVSIMTERLAAIRKTL